MPKSIYNEGRVVGLSAYELYLRQHLSEVSPESGLKPASEMEWMSSMLGSGSSLILKLPKGTNGTFETELPVGSRLCAASTITATLFDGKVSVDSAGWATQVVSYGQLISNTSNSSPVTKSADKDTVPEGTRWSALQREQMREYLKIVDGLVFQEGNWTSSGKTEPSKDFTPNLSDKTYIRFKISNSLTCDVYILLTGWLNKTVIAGLSALDGESKYTSALSTANPENGDFLGPQSYPWASKVIFTIPSSILDTLYRHTYARTMSGGTSKIMNTQPVVDYQDSNLDDFYNDTNYKKSVLSMSVGPVYAAGNGASAIGAYQKHTDYPPAVYGKYISNDTNGSDKMYPLDIAAPGTIKAFNSQSLAKNYPKVVPNTYAMYKGNQPNDPITFYFPDSSGNIQQSSVPTNVTIRTSKVDPGPDDNDGNSYYTADVIIGDKKIRAISLQSDDEGNYLDTDGDGGTIDKVDYITWHALLDGLGMNKKIDILGEGLRMLKKSEVWQSEYGDGVQVNVPVNISDYFAAKRAEIGDNLVVWNTAIVNNGLEVNRKISTNQYAQVFSVKNHNIQLSGNIYMPGDIQWVEDGDEYFHFRTSNPHFNFNKAISCLGHIRIYREDSDYDNPECLFLGAEPPSNADYKARYGTNIPNNSIWIGKM